MLVSYSETYWRFCPGPSCAPIATDTRRTLDWYLRRIAGPGLTFVYNIANAVLYCVLAGAMIAVSATALGLAFDIATPALIDIYPNSLSWVLTTFAIGTVITVFAILGFEKLSRFAGHLALWIFLALLAGAAASLPKLGVSDFGSFLDVATTKIWNGVPSEGQEKFGFWHITFFCMVRELGNAYRAIRDGAFSLRAPLELRPLFGNRHVSGTHACLDLLGHHGCGR